MGGMVETRRVRPLLGKMTQGFRPAADADFGDCRDALYASVHAPQETWDFLQPFQPMREENIVDRVFGTM